MGGTEIGQPIIVERALNRVRRLQEIRLTEVIGAVHAKDDKGEIFAAVAIEIN